LKKFRRSKTGPIDSVFATTHILLWLDSGWDWVAASPEGEEVFDRYSDEEWVICGDDPASCGSTTSIRSEKYRAQGGLNSHARSRHSLLTKAK
jgi:hypothetical protein